MNIGSDYKVKFYLFKWIEKLELFYLLRKDFASSETFIYMLNRF